MKSKINEEVLITLVEKVKWIEKEIKILMVLVGIVLITNLDRIIPIIDHFIKVAYAAQ